MNKHYTQKILFLFLSFFSTTLFSQNVGINITGATPSINAILDLNTGNSNNVGLLIPNVTLGASLTTFNPPMANAATAGDKGMMVFNKVATNQPVGYYYWDGGTWVSVSGGGGNVTACGTASSGYFPYFTSATGICSSVLYQASTTTVGLGTTTPKSMLDVNGGVAIGTYAGVTAAPANGVIVSGQVGIGTSAPNAGAVLDITSSTLGLLIPRLAANPATPVTSMLYFNTTTGCFMFYTGAAWQNIICSCSSAPPQPGVITGPTSFCVNSAGNTYSIVTVAGATSYTWTVPASVGVIASGQGSTSITVTGASSGGSGVIDVTASNSCGTSAARSTATITVNPVPTAPVITSTFAFACPGQAGLTYTVPAVGGVTYLWAVPAAVGTITAGQGTTTVTITAASPGSTGNVTCTESNACGAGTPGTFSVNTTGHGSLTFNYTGNLQYWVVPSCVTNITITAAGASGGFSLSTPGNGAVATSGSVNVAGDTIYMAVGEEGSGSGWGGGGGGGSFAWVGANPTTYPLAAGGGGGGGGGTGTAGAGSLNLVATNNGTSANGAGGTTGHGGAAGTGVAAGGAGTGWVSNGAPAAATAHLGQGGEDPANNFAGGAGSTSANEPGGDGGFGGGGGGGSASTVPPYGGGGGGGGFNGGGGGNGTNAIAGEFGGGGGSSGYYTGGAPYATLASFIAPASATQANTSDGYITITW